ncbi:FkbM family methyltransferase, partial [Spirochaetota bacterium]
LLLKSIIQPGKKVFDIGAHIGEYLYVLEHIIPSNLVYAFEPVPHLYEKILLLFPGMNIFNYAVSGNSGKMQFKIPYIQNKQVDTRGTLEISGKEENESGRIIFPVDAITLDEFTMKNKIHDIGLIKIDVEGHEIAVLEGSRKIIEKERPVMIIEIEQRHHEGKRVNEIITYVESYGYTGWYIDRDALQLKEVTEEVCEQQKSDHTGSGQYINNFIFFPKTNYKI